MGKVRTIARRSFLIGSAAIAGGVAFGTYAIKKPHANPLLDDLADGEAALTPYVKIDRAGITLITPRTDKGQGSYHVQAALIAEELDVELDQITVDPGAAAPVYYNTAFSDEGAPFMSTDDSFTAETVRSAVGVVSKVIGLHGTGGSTTVADGYMKLRVAGATARETLKMAAAKRAGVSARDLKTENGHVILVDGSRLSYQQLAADAAKLTPPDDVALRDESDWRLLGKPMQRLDIVAKSTGTQAYGIDMEMDGMVHASVKMNPYKGGKLIRMDADGARRMRGVQDVFFLEGGVGVIADNTWRCFQALEAIDCEWAKGDYLPDQADHWAELGRSFIEDRLMLRNRNDGDAVGVVQAADAPVSAEYRAPYVAHAPLEPLSATVLYTEERTDIWTCSQMPILHRDNAARITGQDATNIHVHVLMAGGSFGHRLEDEQVKQAVEIAMRKPGVPVKLTYRREEDMLHDFPRQIALSRASGTVKDGKIDALDLGIAMPSPFTSQAPRAGLPPLGPDMQVIAGAWNAPYGIPNFRVSGYHVPGLSPVSSWRSVGASTNAFFLESFMDELCHQAGLDPLEQRLALCWDPTATKVLEAVAQMSGWGSALTPDADGNARGRGLAFCTSFGTPVAEVVEVTQRPDGIKIDRVYVAADVGKILDPVNFEGQVKGGVVFGLGHAMNCELTYSDGVVEQDNYHAHEGMRLKQTPEIMVRGLENGPKIRGVGEPPVPPAAPALANAIFDATGQRLREMPFHNFIDFV